MKRTVLLTGFEPFGGDTVNASALSVAAVDELHLGEGTRLVRTELPCVFGRAVEALRAELRRVGPDVVVCVGQAGGRGALCLERVAINIDDAPIPDNAGAQPIDAKIAPRGPAAYWSTLPIKKIALVLQAHGLPAEVSETAGTFVCNHVFYGLMRALARRPGVLGGFIHVPLLPEQAVGRYELAPSLALADQARGLELAIATALAATRAMEESVGR